MSEQVFLANGGIAIPSRVAGAEPVYDFGWQRNPAAVRAILATLPFPRYEDCARHLDGSGDGKSVLLSDAYKKLFGQHMPAQQQPRGTCVSRGWSRSVDYLESVQIGLLGLPQEYKSASHAYIYGTCREIGGDLSYSDGAVGAWAAKAVNTMGVISNEDCQDKDAGYDDLAVQWGARGVPQKFKDLGKQRLVKTVTLVDKPEQARDMLVNGYPVSCCSSQGFSMTRDSEGHCRAQGLWPHCMMWSGYRDDKKWFLVEQSWGQNTPGGPLGSMDIPNNSFWIDWDVAARMLREQDSFALSSFDGWPAQTIPWVF